MLRPTVRAQPLRGAEIGEKMIPEEFCQKLAGNSLDDLETFCFIEEKITKPNKGFPRGQLLAKPFKTGLEGTLNSIH